MGMQHVLKHIYQSLKNTLQRSAALEIYTDGSSKAGVGSWAYVVSRNGQSLTENSGRVRRANSNSMEFQAAIEALSSIPDNKKIILFSDSRILVDAMKLGTGPAAHQAQIDSLTLLKSKHRIEWRWIKAHNGNAFNERCDELCALARSTYKPLQHSYT